MTGNDACNRVKTDLKAGTFTHYTTSFPIYIHEEDQFQGGNVYISLRDSKRPPVQSFTGSVIYNKKKCTLTITASNKTDRDNLHDDVIEVLTTAKPYKIVDVRDSLGPQNLFSEEIDIEVLN